MKGKLHTIPSDHLINENDEDKNLAEYLGTADVLDPCWGLGKFQGVFNETTRKPAYGKAAFKDASYIGEFDDNADFSGQGILMFEDGGGFASGVFERGRFTHGIALFNDSGMTAIIRGYLEDGSWLGTVFYDEDGGWADGIFAEDWTLLEGDEFDSDGNVVRDVDPESDEDDG